jgi:hypothetical protein
MRSSQSSGTPRIPDLSPKVQSCMCYTRNPSDQTSEPLNLNTQQVCLPLLLGNQAQQVLANRCLLLAPGNQKTVEALAFHWNDLLEDWVGLGPFRTSGDFVCCRVGPQAGRVALVSNRTGSGDGELPTPDRVSFRPTRTCCLSCSMLAHDTARMVCRRACCGCGQPLIPHERTQLAGVYEGSSMMWVHRRLRESAAVALPPTPFGLGVMYALRCAPSVS